MRRPTDTDRLQARRIHIGWEVWADPVWVPYEERGGKLGTISIDAAPFSQKLRERLSRWSELVDHAFFDEGQRIDAASRRIQDLDKQGVELWESVVSEAGGVFELFYDSLIHGEAWRVHRPGDSGNV